MRLFAGAHGFRVPRIPVQTPVSSSDVVVPQRTVPCVSTFGAVPTDAVCGYTALVSAGVGFPKAIPAVHLTTRANHQPPTLAALSFSPSTGVTGTHAIGVHIRTVASPGTKIGLVAFAFRPPSDSGLQAPARMFWRYMARGQFQGAGQAPASVVDKTFTVNVPFDSPGDWRFSLLLGDNDGSAARPNAVEDDLGPDDMRFYEADDLQAAGRPSTLSVAAGPVTLTVEDPFQFGDIGTTNHAAGTVTSTPGDISCTLRTLGSANRLLLNLGALGNKRHRDGHTGSRLRVRRAGERATLVNTHSAAHFRRVQT